MPILQLRINGQEYTTMVKPTTSLLDMLRKQLSITGSKMGCNTGDCGICSVLVNGKQVRSCLMLAMNCQDKEITTVEGLAPPGQLHPLQVAFQQNYGSQCGYCTPGMIVSAKAFLDENPNPTREEIKEGMIGTLCRCTGYVKIIDSIMAAAKAMQTIKQG